MSNGGYFQITEGGNVRKAEVEKVVEEFDDVIEQVRHYQEYMEAEAEAMADPMIQAGVRGLDNLKWEFMGAQQARAAIG